MSDDDFPVGALQCGSIDHPALNIFVVYCHHQQAWQLRCSGGTDDQPGRDVVVEAGPFDGFAPAVDLVLDALAGWQARCEAALKGR